MRDIGNRYSRSNRALPVPVFTLTIPCRCSANTTGWVSDGPSRRSLAPGPILLRRYFYVTFHGTPGGAGVRGIAMTKDFVRWEVHVIRYRGCLLQATGYS